MSTTALNKNALLEALALNRFFGDYQAVNDFNLSLNKGEVLGLLGPNGAGKSTSMQMLTGNISPSSGEIFIDGINLIDEPEQAKRAIGYLPEQPPVYRDMTVIEYLKYCAALREVSKAARTSSIDDVSERCGLAEVQKKLIGNLSKGFQQRVGIAQAILHRPKVVILDEPTVGLDPLQINQIRQLIRELGEDHAVILSTHILPEVQAVCDRVQIINQGKTVFSDTLNKLAEEQSAHEVLVSFASDVDINLLNKINGVIGVESLVSEHSQSRYRISYDNLNKEQYDPSELFNFAVKHGYTLLELSPQIETLEQTFMNLVYRDLNPVVIKQESVNE